MQIKDLRRSIDYLYIRNDIDTTKIAYAGVSLGGVMGALALAVEPRLRCGILIIAGLGGGVPPGVDEFDYLPRVKQPVLLMNGKYDYWFPYETSQVPFFKSLGTSEEDKDTVFYLGGC